ncbi:MAG: AFG1/ZapE family ATPase [Gammaproteobacteria bacterium]
MPAIDLLERHTEVVHVDGLTDYRLRVLETAEIWQAPLDESAAVNLERYFDQIASGPGVRDTHLKVQGREIPARRRAAGVVWFDFASTL